MQNQAASAVIAKAKQKRSSVRGNVARMAPDGINTMSDDGKYQTAIGRGTPGTMTKPAVRGPRLQGSFPAPDQAVSGPGGAAPPGSRPAAPPLPPGAETGMRPGGGTSPGASGAPPGGGQNLMALLPPKMQAAMAQNGRDPREAINTRMQNDENFRQKMIGLQQQGGFPGAPPMGGPPSGPIAMPMPSGPPGGFSPGGGYGMQQAPGGPPGSDIGPPMQVQGAIPGGPPPGGMQAGFSSGMDPQQLRRMLPPAMQVQGAPGAYQGNPQGLNLQSIQQQMQGGGPAPGPMGGGGQGMNPFRGMM